MTKEDFLAALELPAGVQIADLRFIEQQTIDPIKNMEPVVQANSVTCWIKADNKELCLEGARSVLASVSGQETYVRVWPEAESQKNFFSDEWEHRGYVRFSFFDRPGKQHAPESGEVRYVGLAR